ncbi:hypothetical protein K525DRAFT_200608 [Schizophyllum commune Loenen D]|nr:hypothetical protein K525DRAFT_200608 [Schizophyllum commune Loenen D]
MNWQPQEIPRPESPLITQLNLQATWLSAYNIVYVAERAYTAKLNAQEALSAAAKKQLETDRIYLRLIGWLYVFALRPNCWSQLSLWVKSCNNDMATLVDLGRFLLVAYLRLFRKYKGCTPSHSSHPSRSSFDRRREALETQIVPTPMNHSEARRRALERDNDQCMFTKKFSDQSALYLPTSSPATKQAIIDAASAFPRGVTREVMETNPFAGVGDSIECAHILSESTNQDINAQAYKRAWAASVWSVLESFGHPEICEELAGDHAHRLENVFSLTYAMHDRFDRMVIWLEALGDNRYQANGAVQYEPIFLNAVYSTDGIIEFTTPDATAYPLPSQHYIELHAAACKVAHMSGAAGLFDEFDEALDEDGVLAEDGSQMYILEHRLLQAAAAMVN